MKRNHFKKLIKKYLNGTATEEEKSFVEGWYNYLIKASSEVNELSESELEGNLELLRKKIFEDDVKEKTRPVIHIWTKVGAVASLILGLFIGYYSFFSKGEPERSPLNGGLSANMYYYLEPGAWKDTVDHLSSYFKSSGGELIKIDDDFYNAFNGEFQHKNFETEKDGTLVFKTEKNNPIQYSGYFSENQLVYVPRGKTRKVVLPDGSKVWLNSESSISFPEKFSWNNRKVEVSGELYFEVVKDKQRPFIVSAKEMEIRVLGTSFNVSSYDDDDLVETILVSGAVNVYDLAGASQEGPNVTTLKPGEKWFFNKSTQVAGVDVVNTDEALGWREGLITFKNLDLKSIMRKVSRLYDVEVHFDHFDHSRRFTGGVSNNIKLEDFIQIMKLYDVDINLDDGVLVIK